MSSNTLTTPLRYFLFKISTIVIFFGLLSLILLNGIATFPFLEQLTEISLYKKIIFCVTLLLMGYYVVAEGVLKKSIQLNIIFTTIIITYALNFIIRNEYTDQYISLIITAIFSYLFILYIGYTDISIRLFLRLLYYGLTILNVFFLILLLFSLANNDYSLQLILSGFGGNRVNFSVYLLQLICLNFFLGRLFKTDFLLLLFFVNILLTIQVFTSGRTGVICSLAVIIYFTLEQYSTWFRRGLVIAASLVVIFISNKYSPTAAALDAYGSTYTPYNILAENIDLSRGFDSWDNQHIFRSIDILTSYRLSIIIDAFKKISFSSLFFGLGVDNFYASSNRGTWSVHNVMIRYVGELGILATALFIWFIILPFRYYKANKGYVRDLLFIWLIAIAISQVVSRFLLYGIGNSLIFMLIYSLIVRASMHPEFLYSNRSRHD